MRADFAPRDFAVFRSPVNGVYGFCHREFVIRTDWIVADDLTPDEAAELTDRLECGEVDPIAAVAGIIGSVRFMVPVGRIS